MPRISLRINVLFSFVLPYLFPSPGSTALVNKASEDAAMRSPICSSAGDAQEGKFLLASCAPPCVAEEQIGDRICLPPRPVPPAGGLLHRASSTTETGLSLGKKLALGCCAAFVSGFVGGNAVKSAGGVYPLQKKFAASFTQADSFLSQKIPFFQDRNPSLVESASSDRREELPWSVVSSRHGARLKLIADNDVLGLEDAVWLADMTGGLLAVRTLTQSDERLRFWWFPRQSFPAAEDLEEVGDEDSVSTNNFLSSRVALNFADEGDLNDRGCGSRPAGEEARLPGEFLRQMRDQGLQCEKIFVEGNGSFSGEEFVGKMEKVKAWGKWKILNY